MKISFIGHGNMAKAIIADICRSPLCTPSDIFTSDSDATNQSAVDFADFIFLTIKPQHHPAVLAPLQIPANKILITVAPGITTYAFLDNSYTRNARLEFTVNAGALDSDRYDLFIEIISDGHLTKGIIPIVFLNGVV